MMAKLYWRVKRNGKWTWRPARAEWDEIWLCWTVKNQEEEE